MWRHKSTQLLHFPSEKVEKYDGNLWHLAAEEQIRCSRWKQSAAPQKHSVTDNVWLSQKYAMYRT